MYLLIMLGAALLFGDGVITPAISVLSAVEGAGILNPNWVQFAVPITVGVLVALFAFQYKGTAKIGQLFGPIMLLWFITIGGFGAIEISKHPSVFKALSPTYAINFVAHEGFHTFVILSSVILAITGVEALYADMGHFGAKAIKISWFVVVWPALILNYLGQAAEEVTNPGSINSLFFNMAPNHAWLIYMVIISTLATVIASQALISGVASITYQAINLEVFPRFKVVHTSASEKGQIYVPIINTMLGIGSVALVVGFQTSAKLADAYAFTISGTMLITTMAFFILITQRWKWNIYLSTLVMGSFLLVDIAFFASTSTKVFKGAWAPLSISLAILYIIWIWRRGQIILTKYLARHSAGWESLENLIESSQAFRSRNAGIFLTNQQGRIPQALVAQIRNMHGLPGRIVVVSVKILDEPYAIPKEAVVEHKGEITFVNAKFGYKDFIHIPNLLLGEVLTVEEEAAATYYLSDRKFNNRSGGEMRGFQEQLFTYLHRNSAPVGPHFNIPDERLVTLGVQIDL
jgi:KUP system potassium uptake protein